MVPADLALGEGVVELDGFDDGVEAEEGQVAVRTHQTGLQDQVDRDVLLVETLQAVVDVRLEEGFVFKGADDEKMTWCEASRLDISRTFLGGIFLDKGSKGGQHVFLMVCGRLC